MLGSWNIKKLLAIIVLVLLCSGVVNAEKYEGKNLKVQLSKIKDNLLPEYLVSNKKKYSSWFDES